MFHAKSFLAITAAVMLFLATTLAHAQESRAELEDGSAGAIVVDALFLRPAGFVGTVLGTVAFVVTLPFSAPTRSAENAAQKLVVEPAKFTFARPLGELPKDPR